MTSFTATSKLISAITWYPKQKLAIVSMIIANARNDDRKTNQANFSCLPKLGYVGHIALQMTFAQPVVNQLSSTHLKSVPNRLFVLTVPLLSLLTTERKCSHWVTLICFSSRLINLRSSVKVYSIRVVLNPAHPDIVNDKTSALPTKHCSSLWLVSLQT